MDFIRVATFNVHHICHSPTNDKVTFTIANCGADVVCLQETNEKWETCLGARSEIRQAYPNIRFHNQRGNSWAGFAVLSKFPIETFQVLPQVETWWYPAGLITISLPSLRDSPKQLRTLQLLTVHLRAPVEWSQKPYWWGGHANWVGGFFSERVQRLRLDEIETFSKALNPELPTLILGDFNERRNSSNCLNYLRYLGFENIPKEGGSCFGQKSSWCFEIGGLPLLCFDYDHIVYSKQYLEPADDVALVHKDGGSDHRLVSADFRFKEA
jgi:endonuclease/exonuclease/phosphatase family metal-dependent hydrolase